MPDFFGWLKRTAAGATLNMAIGGCAQAFADYIDQEGITPEALEGMIVADVPMFKDALAKLSREHPAEFAAARNTFGAVASEFRRTHRAPDGKTWHPYKAVLQEDVMGKAHAAHVAVLERNQNWYRRQMDEALAWLFGSPGA